MEEFAFETRALTKRFRKKTALAGVSLGVPKGAVYGLIGRNGAGKTTLLSIAAGLLPQTDGDYTLLGAPSGAKSLAAARRRTGCLIDTPAVFTDLSAMENMRYQYRLLGLPDDGAAALLREVGLDPGDKTRARAFSRGTRQRLGVALALCGSPDLLILDEPVNGIDPEGVVRLRELILRLNRERGVTVLLSSHLLDELSRVCTHYGFLDAGKLIEALPARELVSRLKRCTRVCVSSAAALIPALDGAGIRYEAASDTALDVFGDVSFSALAALCETAGVSLLTAESRNEDLEGYFMNLLGGEDHA